MFYFVVFPIGERCLSAEIRGYEARADALTTAEEMATRYPLVILAEDFGARKRMGLVKIFGAAPTADDWADNILSSFGGCWAAVLEMKARFEAPVLAGPVVKSSPFDESDDNRHGEQITEGGM
jgi:hypothetical protein